MNSSEASESDPNKKNSVLGVSSRLLKGTSASLAKSGVTPTLTRKFGSPKTQKTPTIGPRYIYMWIYHKSQFMLHLDLFTHS
jgi:hypothetical protein